MQGGSDAKDWAPIRLNPNDPTRPYGTHKGHMKGLNVQGLRPGYHVAYASRLPQMAGFTQSMILQGYRPVQAESGTRCGLAPGQYGAPQDSTVGLGNLMLMEIPIEQYRELKVEQERRRLAATDAPTAGYLGRNEEFAAAQGPKSRGRRVAYAMPEHGRNGYEVKEFGEE
jgi:hypothetical protein